MKVIKVDHMSKVYSGGIKAVTDLSFDLDEGIIFGFLGPNGAGKSTTIKVLATLTDITSGHAKILGVDVSSHPARVRELIGYVPQDISSDGGLTGYENLLLCAKLHDIPSRLRKARIREILDLMELTPRANHLVSTYSGGMVRRLEIGQAMLHKPRLLFLDEPTIGLDPSGRKLVWEHIRKLNKDSHVTIFLTTHYMEEADTLCSKVGIINRGRLSVIGTPGELKEKVGLGTITTVLDLSKVGDVVKEKDRTKYLSKLMGPLVASVRLRDGKYDLLVKDAPNNAPGILQKLMDSGITVSHIEVKNPTLEDAFMKFTGASLSDDGSKGEWHSMRGRRRTFRRLA